MWDKVLTANQISKLFDDSFMVVSSKQVVHPVRMTVEGDHCVFPGILR